MRNRAFCAALLLAIFPVLDAPYRVAMPGYRYEFPRDFFAHPEFQTEWWYTTGNVKTADGRAFGFELTFFREAVNRDASKQGAWDLRDIYLAHLALSDLDGGHFYHSERVNRSGPGIAGVDSAGGKVWNGNWSAVWKKDGSQELAARCGDFEFDFTLKSEKMPVVHGENGVSQKAEGAGRASHYFSQTRLATNGTIFLQGKQFRISGLSWMDHEFFTHQLSADQTGWDWFSIQLEDKTELMLFILRRQDGSIDPHSAGTYVDASGKATHLRANEFSLTPTGPSWKSVQTGATYPIAWNVVVPKLMITLSATTRLPQQELAATSKFAPGYWEGAMQFSGKRGSADILGVGYLEMTGYDHPLRWTK
jgi:predicted secreted hydrolase